MNLALLALLVFGLFSQEPAQPVRECPPGFRPVAKWETDLWDPGVGHESGFEFGAEWIDIGTVYMGGTEDVLHISFFVIKGPITHAYVKAGIEGDQLYTYDPYLQPDPVSIPPPEYTVETLSGQGISHVTWCSTEVPTAITLTSMSAEERDDTFLAAGSVIFALMMLAGIIVVGAVRRGHGKKQSSKL